MPAYTSVSIEYYKLSIFSYSIGFQKKKIKLLKIGLRLAKCLMSGVAHVNEVSRNFFFAT